MKNLIILLLVPLLFACGQSNFAKRKYTKGVYVEKRTHVKSRKSKVESEKYDFAQAKMKKKEVTQLENKIEKESDETSTSSTITYGEESSKINSTSDQLILTSREGKETIEEVEVDDSESSEEKQEEYVRSNGNGTGLFWAGTSLAIIGAVLLSLQYIWFSLFLGLGLSILVLGLILGIVGFLKMKKSKAQYENAENKGNGKHKGKAIASVTLGSLAAFFMPFGYLIGALTWSYIAIISIWAVGLALAIAAIVFSILTLNKKDEISQKERSMAIAGLVLGILAAIVAIIMICLFLIGF